MFSPTTLQLFCGGLLLPLASAFVYLFIYPYPARWIYEITRKHAQALDKVRKKYDGLELLPLDKSRQLRAEIALADAEHKKEVDRLNEKIVELKATQEALAESKVGLNDVQRSEVAAMQPDSMMYFGGVAEFPMSEAMDKVLDFFAVDSGRISESGVLDGTDLSSIDTKYALGELVRRNLLDKTSSPTRGVSYALTHEGRGWLLTKRATPSQKQNVGDVESKGT